MRHKLEQLLAERISTGLRRNSIGDSAKWACEYRIMGQPYPGKWTFDHHPWSYGMHKAEGDLLIGQKAAQMAYTEWGLNTTFHGIDINGYSVLYVLPASKPDATDFSTGRFDPALENSPHLKNLFTDVKNIHHKRAGFSNLFIRGSRSRSQLKSIPVSIIILDEVDEMKQDNIPLVFERTSGQLFKRVLMISTPTIENYGINHYFNQSTQEHYFFKCPHCSKWTELIWPDCMIITAEEVTDPGIVNSHYICKECKHVLDHDAKINWLSVDNAKWVPAYADRISRGFYVPQLYSMTVKPHELALSYLKSKKDQAAEQEFHNSKLGLPHTVEGAKLTDKDIDKCIGDYVMSSSTHPSNLVTMGIDVGNKLHYEIDRWVFDPETTTMDVNILASCQVLRHGAINHFEDLDNLIRKFHVNFIVIDANPERRKAFEFAQRFFGYVRLCFYSRGITGKAIQLHDEAEATMSVDRTTWMDVALGRFRSETIVLPKDIDLEYRKHIKAPTRIYKKDKNDNPVGRYVVGNEGDHYAHARTYAEIALKLAVAVATNQDITNEI